MAVEGGNRSFEQVSLGSSYEKQCKLPGGDKFQDWRDQSNKVMEEGRRGSRVVEGDTLTIRPVEIRDAQVYRCNGLKSSVFYGIHIPCKYFSAQSIRWVFYCAWTYR